MVIGGRRFRLCDFRFDFSKITCPFRRKAVESLQIMLEARGKVAKRFRQLGMIRQLHAVADSVLQFEQVASHLDR